MHKAVNVLGHRIHVMTLAEPRITRRVQPASTNVQLASYRGGICVRPIQRFSAVAVTWNAAAV